MVTHPLANFFMFFNVSYSLTVRDIHGLSYKHITWLQDISAWCTCDLNLFYPSRVGNGRRAKNKARFFFRTIITRIRGWPVLSLAISVASGAPAYFNVYMNTIISLHISTDIIIDTFNNHKAQCHSLYKNERSKIMVQNT